MADYDPTLNAIVERMKSPGWEDEARAFIASHTPTNHSFYNEFEQWKFGAQYQMTIHDPDDDQEVTEILSYNELLFRLKEYSFDEQIAEIFLQLWGEYNGTGVGLPSIHTPFLDLYFEVVV